MTPGELREKYVWLRGAGVRRLRKTLTTLKRNKLSVELLTFFIVDILHVTTGTVENINSDCITFMYQLQETDVVYHAGTFNGMRHWSRY